LQVFATKVAASSVQILIFPLEIAGKVDESKASSKAAEEEEAPAAAASTAALPGDETEAGVPNPFDFSAMTGLLNVCHNPSACSTGFSLWVIVNLNCALKNYSFLKVNIFLCTETAILCTFLEL
jgi:hypothetical protein